MSNREIVIRVEAIGINNGVLPFGGRMCSSSTVRNVCMPKGTGTRVGGSTATKTISKAGPRVAKNLSVNDRLVTKNIGNIIGTAGRTTDGGVGGIGIAVGAGCTIFLVRGGRAKRD